jgi:serine protease Do
MKSDRRLLAGAIPLSALVGGITASLVFGGVAGRPVTAQETVSLTAEQRTTATALEGAFMRIADTVGPATVRIASINAPPPTVADRRRPGTDNNSDDEDDSFPFGQFFGPNTPRLQMPTPRVRRATGSGVIIRPDGWVITNDHVVEDSTNGRVRVILSDNTEYTGKVFRDRSSDLAVIKIDAGKPLPYVKMADSSGLRVGQWAIAIGSPFAQQNTMTTGIVSALHRSRAISDDATARYYSDLIQTDAAINPGNSGGPLLNINGELIGVNVAILSQSGSSAGVGFAIPANTAKMVADQLISKGKVTRSSLGVVPTDIPPLLRGKVGAKGAYVGQVAADTPADKAGIQPGDVITRFGTTDVSDEISLRNAIASASPGTAVPITLSREGKTVSVSATLVARDEPPGGEQDGGGGDGAAARPTPPARRRANELGINARALTSELLEGVSAPAGTKGVFVGAVVPGSPASEAGLERGMIITAVNGKPVTAVDALNSTMQTAKSGDVYTLSVLIPLRNSRPNKGVINVPIP